MPSVVHRFVDQQRHSRRPPARGVRPIVWLAGWLAVSASLLSAEPPAPLKTAEQPPPRKIKEATPTDGAIDVEHGNMTRFQVDVPADAVLMTVCVTRSPLVLEILARKGESLEATADAEYRSYSDSFRPKLLVSRQSNPALETGIFTIAVAYTARCRR